MCGRFLLYTCEDYEELLSIIKEVELNNPTQMIYDCERAEIYPGSSVPIILSAMPALETASSMPILDSTTFEKSIRLSKWGFPDSKNKGRLLINARAETLDEKPTFQKLVYSKRCLIPALGFYEWRSTGGPKDKFLVRPENSNFFFMAGLFHQFAETSAAGASEPGTRFVVVTTAANDEMQRIHDRMPVMITTTEAASSWLDASAPWATKVKPLLSSFEGHLHLENLNPQLQFQI